MLSWPVEVTPGHLEVSVTPAQEIKAAMDKAEAWLWVCVGRVGLAS